MRISNMTRVCSNSKAAVILAVIVSFSLVLTGCMEEEKTEKSKPKLEVKDLPESVVEAYDNSSTMVNFTLESKLGKNTMIYISNLEWKDILPEGVAEPSTTFYVDESISSNETQRIYIANETTDQNKAFLPKDGSININLVLKNTDKSFRSGTLNFVIKSSETSDKKTVTLDVRYL